MARTPESEHDQRRWISHGGLCDALLRKSRKAFHVSQPLDRSAEDLSNVIRLEHINTAIPSQSAATTFYVTGLGLTRDPYMMTGVSNMWINVGRGQFHLPTGEPQVLRGHVGLILQDRHALLGRLAAVSADLAGSAFAFMEQEAHVEVISPWGNHFRCYEPSDRFGPFSLGIAYAEFLVPKGSAELIARFYREILESFAEVDDRDGVRVARCSVGHCQSLLFRESNDTLPPYDEHHIQIYLVNISRPHARLVARGLISEESNQWQYRFRDIVDLDTGRVVFTVEHEVRSMTHPLFGRQLINRDSNQT